MQKHAIYVQNMYPQLDNKDSRSPKSKISGRYKGLIATGIGLMRGKPVAPQAEGAWA